MYATSSVCPDSAPDARRVVCILIDGVRPDVLQQLLDKGDLPNLARWVIEPGGLTAGTTVFPSTTGVAYIPFLFGRYPGPANVPGIRWFDRTGADGGLLDRWRAARSYCGPQAGWINRDIARGPSLFDLVPESLAICTPITRGLGRGAHLMPVRRAVLGAAAHYRGSYAALDRAVAHAWIAAAARPWRFLFVVFPGPDGLTHLHDPGHPKVLEACRQIDDAFGEFMWRARGSGEPPAVFVVADHGASAVSEHRDVALELEAMGVRTIRHPMHVWRRRARAAVMVSGNGAAHVYLLGARAETTHLVERLIRLPGVALGAWRDGRGGVVVARGHLQARLADEGALVTYDPLLGDPLGLGRLLRVDDRELLARSLTTEFPDAPRQLLQLLSSPRSGDVVLAAERGVDFRGDWEIPEHRSGHGSLIADHMMVPIAASIPLPDVPVRTVDLMPTMLDALGVAIPDGLDGVSFSRLGTPAGAAL
ncbi:MAG TPA: alkaline phosphatase family protein [Gemmatimonadales bacterium]|nr:alkaline phosphatase family protein [Gemmatimonadales bacterium]